MDPAIQFRTESDYLGTLEVPSEALYGIHSLRARTNFPYPSAFSLHWYKAMGKVKQACYLTVSGFRKALEAKNPEALEQFRLPEPGILEALELAAAEVADGRYYEEFIVPAISGGAGTSINMNINEIITNAALIHIGKKPGNYAMIDPIEAANIYQSTNDVVPTALRVAAMGQLNLLEDRINELRKATEHSESLTRNELRIAYTQMQEAVPSSYGKLFSTYSEALSRDWWRVSKCFERIKTVNLGGSAIGTGIGIPRYFIMEVTPALQRISGQPITRSENLSDATCNLDPIVEVHAILKSHAVNLEKMVSDLRLLASDLVAVKGIKLPQRQVGSSIMPGKVNPVIPEYVISIAHKVYSNDMLISGLCAQGCLDLNAYLPAIGDALLESLGLLVAADESLLNNLFRDITIITGSSLEHLMRSPSVTTALSPYIGYNNAALLALEMKKNNSSVVEANTKLGLMDPEKLNHALEPENLLRAGFTLKDILA